MSMDLFWIKLTEEFHQDIEEKQEDEEAKIQLIPTAKEEEEAKIQLLLTAKESWRLNLNCLNHCRKL